MNVNAKEMAKRLKISVEAFNELLAQDRIPFVLAEKGTAWEMQMYDPDVVLKVMKPKEATKKTKKE